jgi:hypothetical protein
VACIIHGKVLIAPVTINQEQAELMRADSFDLVGLLLLLLLLLLSLLLPV